MISEDLYVIKPKLHESQAKVIEYAKRYNTLCIGRRWGKTKLAIRLAMETILKGGSVGYFVPTYEFSDDFWDEIKERLEPIIKKKSETKRSIETVNGGKLKIWSLEKKRAGRGRKYHRIIIDEAAFTKDLKESWERAIRPTLTDYQGDAWFLSTPQGFQNYFHHLFVNAEKYDNWASFQMASETNPLLSKDELQEVKSQLDDLTFAQEFEAKFVDFTGRPFAYSFDKEKHIGKLGKPKKSLPLCLSFDFNVDPITCTVSQQDDAKSYKYFYKEFRLSNSDIYLLCDSIFAEYGDDYYIKVTGDASGNSRSAMVEDNLNYYLIIQKKLGLPNERFFVPNVNPSIRASRVLLNSVLARHKDVKFDESMVFAIEDLKYVEVGDDGEINKSKDKHRSHLLDCIRYDFNAFNKDFLKNVLKD